MRFGNIVKNQLKFNQSDDQLSQMSLEQLENMLSHIRIHLDNLNIDGFYKMMINSLAVMYEQVLSPFYDID